MTWKVEIEETARRELRKLDPTIQARILGFLRQRIAVQDDPRRLGKALKGSLRHLWRYQIGDYRVLCQIEDPDQRVAVMAIGHRSEVYR